MRFGIWPSPTASWPDILALASHCEATGWDTVYFADHFMPSGPGAEPASGDTIECWSVLAALAATVPRVRLAPLVTSITYRHPAVLANVAAAVDQIAGGRLTLGIGAGWQENEHVAYGLDLGTPKERLDRFEEAIEVLLGLLRSDRTSMQGEYFSVSDAPNEPKPVQERMPLLVGGSGEKRTMKIAARHADEWNAWTEPDLLRHKVDVLHRHCDTVGRDPADIHVSTQALTFISEDEAQIAKVRGVDFGRASLVGSPTEVADALGAYRAAGADEFILPGFTFRSLAEGIETCDQFIELVADDFR